MKKKLETDLKTIKSEYFCKDNKLIVTVVYLTLRSKGLALDLFQSEPATFSKMNAAASVSTPSNRTQQSEPCKNVGTFFTKSALIIGWFGKFSVQTAKVIRERHSEEWLQFNNRIDKT